MPQIGEQDMVQAFSLREVSCLCQIIEQAMKNADPSLFWNESGF